MPHRGGSKSDLRLIMWLMPRHQQHLSIKVLLLLLTLCGRRLRRRQQSCLYPTRGVISVSDEADKATTEDLQSKAEPCESLSVRSWSGGSGYVFPEPSRNYAVGLSLSPFTKAQYLEGVCPDNRKIFSMVGPHVRPPPVIFKDQGLFVKRGRYFCKVSIGHCAPADRLYRSW